MDGDGQFERQSAPAEQGYTFRQTGARTVSCRVRDGDGGEVVVEHRIFVANEVPTLELAVDSPQNEGTEVVIRAIGEDAGGDQLSYRFDVDGDGVIDYGPGPESIVRHVYPREGEYIVRAYATDGVDEIDAFARLLIVKWPLVRPTSNTPINEGDMLRLAVEASDAGDDAMTITWDLMVMASPMMWLECPWMAPLFREITATDDARFNAGLGI